MIIIYAPLTFDIPHFGHYKFLQKCKNLGDKLYIGLHNDFTLSYYKRNPIYSMEHRVFILESCKYIDKVIPNAPLTIDEKFIKQYNINYVVHAHSEEENELYNFVFKKVPKEMRIRLDYLNTISSTLLLKKIKNRVEPYLTSNNLLNKYGFLMLNNIISKNLIENIYNNLDKIKNNSIIYFNNNKKILRIEKFYKNNYYCNILQKKIKIFLENLLDSKIFIFKDKINYKYPTIQTFKCHYDGIFETNNIKGWYQYDNYFVNVLINLNNFGENTGNTIISKSHENNYEKLLKNTNNDGTPFIKDNIIKKLKIFKTNLNIGDILIFKNTCPHGSEVNNSDDIKITLIYTYCLKENNYDRYYKDKLNTDNNLSKALQ